uniref:phosphatidylserine decarboxylase n=1 Tax=Globodera rostochiensis TaxID=31243 RepID=A0A914HAN6_GLORO
MFCIRCLSSSTSPIFGVAFFRSFAVAAPSVALLAGARLSVRRQILMPPAAAALSSSHRHSSAVHSRRRSSTSSVYADSARSRPLRRSKRRLFKWLFLGTLSAFAGFCLWDVFVPSSRERQDPTHYYTDWKIRLYTKFPWNAVSSIVGFLSNIPIPVVLRAPIYGVYVRFFNCRMDEAAEESLQAYPTFAAFFTRPLRPGVRPISHSLLVSPADGTVLHFGKVVDGRVEFVKDSDYELHEFLGPVNADTRVGNALYQVVIYLAPGDYHAFHSPTTWRVQEKVYFPGSLLSVNPSFVDWIPKILCLNERIVLSGQWHYGYFSLCAVAATNVGDIVITNEPVKNRRVHATEQYSIFDESMRFKPGDKVGEFRLGSTVVLVFEAPDNIDFCIRAGDKLRYGQSLLLQPAL